MDFENIIKGLLKVSISKYIIAFIIVTASLIINRYIVTKIFNILIRLVKKTKNYIDDSFFKALESPIKLYILLYSFFSKLQPSIFTFLNHLHQNIQYKPAAFCHHADLPLIFLHALLQVLQSQSMITPVSLFCPQIYIFR